LEGYPDDLSKCAFGVTSNNPVYENLLASELVGLLARGGFKEPPIIPD
jgi:hypothetical protein